jgi:hypothetical protein
MENKKIKLAHTPMELWRNQAESSVTPEKRQQQLKEKNFGLSEAEFNDWLQKLKENGDETLIEKIFTAQYAPCRTFLERKYQVHYDDTHDVVMEVLLKFRTELKQGKWNYNNLSSLFKTQTWQKQIQLSKQKKLVFMEHFDEQQIRQLADSTAIADELLEQKNATAIQAALLKAYTEAFESLCKYCQNLIDIYYIQNKEDKDAKKITWTDMTQIMPYNECVCGDDTNFNTRVRVLATANGMSTKADWIRKKIKAQMEQSFKQTNLKNLLHVLSNKT